MTDDDTIDCDVEETLERLTDIMLQGEVEGPRPDIPEPGEQYYSACAAYFAVLNGSDAWTPTIWQRDPIAVLDELGTDVPTEWAEYVPIEDKTYVDSEDALEAMARRQLEQALYERVEEYRDGETNE